MWTKVLPSCYHAGNPASGKWGARLFSRASRDQRPASDAWLRIGYSPHILADTFVGPFGTAALISTVRPSRHRGRVLSGWSRGHANPGAPRGACVPPLLSRVPVTEFYASRFSFVRNYCLPRIEPEEIRFNSRQWSDVSDKPPKVIQRS